MISIQVQTDFMYIYIYVATGSNRPPSPMPKYHVILENKQKIQVWNNWNTALVQIWSHGSHGSEREREREREDKKKRKSLWLIPEDSIMTQLVCQQQQDSTFSTSSWYCTLEYCVALIIFCQFIAYKQINIIKLSVLTLTFSGEYWLDWRANISKLNSIQIVAISRLCTMPYWNIIMNVYIYICITKWILFLCLLPQVFAGANSLALSSVCLINHVWPGQTIWLV